MSRKRKADNVPNQGRPNPFNEQEGDGSSPTTNPASESQPTPSRADGLESDATSQSASSFAAPLLQSDQMNMAHLQSILNQLLGVHNVSVRSDLNYSHFHQDSDWLSSIQSRPSLSLPTTTAQISLLPLLQMLLEHAGQRPGTNMRGTPTPQAALPFTSSNNIDSANLLSTLQILGRLQNLGQSTSTLPSLFTHNLSQLMSPATTRASNWTQSTSQQPILASGVPLEEARRITASATSARTPTFITMFMSCDDRVLSAYQCLIRKQIELFAAGEEDTCTIGQGRNRRVQLGQVGVRCKHCRDIPQLAKTKGAVYFPFKIDNVYQACQNMAVVHLCDNCPNIPTSIRAELQRLAKDSKSTAGGGKRYWSKGVREAGIVEDAGGRLHFGGNA